MSNPYLRAAKRVDETGMHSCLALGYPGNRERRAYASLFMPEPEEDWYDYRRRDWWCGDDTPENRECRVIALLFMHWIAKEEK